MWMEGGISRAVRRILNPRPFTMPAERVVGIARRGEPFLEFAYCLLEAGAVTRIGALMAVIELGPIDCDRALHPFASLFVSVSPEKVFDPLRLRPYFSNRCHGAFSAGARL